MKKDDLRDAIDLTDEKTVAKFIQTYKQLIKQKREREKRRRSLLVRRAAAACLCVCVIGGALFMLRRINNIGNPPADTTTLYETTVAATSARENLFDVNAFKDKYSGNTVNILCWDSEHTEFEAESETLESGDFLSEAVYKRNKLTSEALGVTLVFNEQNDDSNNAAAMLKYVEEQTAANAPLDAIALYSRTSALLAQKGHLLPLNYLSDYIDLDNPWYPKDIENYTNIGGNTYFVTGDISTSTTFLLYGFIFNKDIVDNTPEIGYTSEELYALARDGKWTLDEMFRLVGSYYVDADGNGVKSVGDGFGLRSYNYLLEAVYYGAGLKICDVNNSATTPEALITVSSDYTGERAIALSKRIGELMAESSYAVNDENFSGNFAKGSSLSFIGRLRDTRKLLLSENGYIYMNYGLLPIPKYDTEQESYISTASTPMSLWGVSSSSGDYDREVMAAAVIEMLGYYGEQNTTEAVFRTVMDGSYAEKADDKVSFDIIKSSLCIDCKVLFWKSNFELTVDWASYAAKNKDWSKYGASGALAVRRMIEEPSKNFYATSEAFKQAERTQP